MEYTLKNKKLTVVFESKGATLHSIKDNDGVELLPAVMRMMCLNIKEGCDSWSLENMKL